MVSKFQDYGMLCMQCCVVKFLKLLGKISSVESPGGRVSSSDNDYGNFDVYEYENDQKAYK